jgi:hypothetical protein
MGAVAGARRGVHTFCSSLKSGGLRERGRAGKKKTGGEGGREGDENLFRSLVRSLVSPPFLPLHVIFSYQSPPPPRTPLPPTNTSGLKRSAITCCSALRSCLGGGKGKTRGRDGDMAGLQVTGSGEGVQRKRGKVTKMAHG